MILLVCCIVVVFLFIVSLFVRIYTKINYLHEKDNDYIKIEVTFLGILIFRKEIPSISLDTEKMTLQLQKDKTDKTDKKVDLKDKFEKVKQFTNYYHNLLSYRMTVKKLLSTITVHQLEWDTKIGTGDASSTGIICGSIWGIKGGIVAFIRYYFRSINQPSIQVIPIFQQKYAFTRFECMVSMRLGQTIYAIIRIIKTMKANQLENVSRTAQ